MAFANEPLPGASGPSVKAPRRLATAEASRARAPRTFAAPSGPFLLAREREREQERERIAIELHDSTSQHLVAVALGLAKLRKIVGEGPQTLDILDDMSRCVAEASREIRVFSYLMKPSGLARDGLAAATAALAKGFAWRTGLSVSVLIEPRVDAASADVAHAAYRVVQEALSNVYRHARARNVTVELAGGHGDLILRIADDGRGIEGARLPGQPIGVGLAGMRARTEQLGGGLEISSDRGGTVVCVRIPSPPAASARLSRRRPQASA